MKATRMLKAAALAVCVLLLAAAAGCPQPEGVYLEISLEGGDTYIPPPPPQYRVTFDLDEGTLNGSTAAPAEQIIGAGGTAIDPGNPVRGTDSFSGWFYGHQKWVFDSHTVTCDILLMARYNTPTYTVKFNSMGGDEDPPDQIIAAGGNALKPAKPVKAGHTFADWYETAAYASGAYSGQPYNFAASVAENITLYAKWTVNSYTVSFNLNGGTYSGPPADINGQTIPYGGHVTAPSQNPVHPSSTIFSGWYCNGAIWDFVNNTVEGDITLTAEWNVPYYTYNKPADASENGVTASVAAIIPSGDPADGGAAQVGGTKVTVKVGFANAAAKAGRFSLRLSSQMGAIEQLAQPFTVTQGQSSFAQVVFTFIVPRVHITDLTLTFTFAEEETIYYEWNGSETAPALAERTKNASDVTPLTGAVLGAGLGGHTGGWYVLDSDITHAGAITLTSNTNIILKDGYTLTVNNKISGGGNSLKIYGQGANGGSGKLIVTASDSGDHAFQGREIEIHGGVITMTGKGSGNGIYAVGGSADSPTSGFFKMYGGTLTASGESSSSYTGSRGGIIAYSKTYPDPTGKITILGGTVTARSNGRAAGIGGRYQSGTSVVIPEINIGGSATVTAYGGAGAAGIGEGSGNGNYALSSNTIKIYGSAVVNAYGGSGKPDGNDCYGGAGIGSGASTNSYDTLYTNGQISISGNARVYAHGGASTYTSQTPDGGGGAGIGSGGAGMLGTVPMTPGAADTNVITGGTPSITAYGGAGTGRGTTGAAIGQGGRVVTVIAYYKWNGDTDNPALEKAEKNASDVTPLTSAVLGAGLGGDTGGWYVLDSDISYTAGDITLNGDTNIILKDGKTLTVSGTIRANTKTLKIYGQGTNGGTGKLTVTAANNNDPALECNGTVEIHGGIISMTGKGTGGGIEKKSAGVYKFAMYGGTLNALGGTGTFVNWGGGGIALYGRNSEITILGGTVYARSDGAGPGIGSGVLNINGNVIDGIPKIKIGGSAVVAAYGGKGAAGIGSPSGNVTNSQSWPDDSVKIEIFGSAVVNAYGGDCDNGSNFASGAGAGIGTGGQPYPYTSSGWNRITVGKIQIRDNARVYARGGNGLRIYYSGWRNSGGGAGIGTGGRIAPYSTSDEARDADDLGAVKTSPTAVVDAKGGAGGGYAGNGADVGKGGGTYKEGENVTLYNKDDNNSYTTPLTSYTFPGKDPGYSVGTAYPDTLTVQINHNKPANIGPLTVSKTGDANGAFILSTTSIPGNFNNTTADAFTVQPRPGLLPGVTYTATITVTGTYRHNKSFTVSYTPLGVYYYEAGWNGSTVIKAWKTQASVTPLTPGMTIYASGWYTSDTISTGIITVSSGVEVNLILLNNTTLTVDHAILLPGTAKLNIYAQYAQTSAAGATPDSGKIQGSGFIGTTNGGNKPQVRIHGGDIELTGGPNSGINVMDGTLTIYDGWIEAKGSTVPGLKGETNEDPSISTGSVITIYGGHVLGQNTGGGGIPGIIAERIIIRGGEVTGKGSDSMGPRGGTGIGGVGCDAIVIYNGNVTGTGGNGATKGGGAGIGGLSTAVTIRGGTVTGTGGTGTPYSTDTDGGGVGIGSMGPVGGAAGVVDIKEIRISGGTVTAIGGDITFGSVSGGGAGIGSSGNANGSANTAGKIFITGGTITAKGGAGGGSNGGGGAGIGSGGSIKGSSHESGLADTFTLPTSIPASTATAGSDGSNITNHAQGIGRGGY